MRTVRRTYANLGIDTAKTVEVLTLAQSLHDGMEADPATYTTPSPPLPALLVLIQNLTTAQQVVTTRVKGAVATRDTERGLLLTAVECERMYVQTLCDATPSRAISLIQRVGLVVGTSQVHSKALLTLRAGKPSGTVLCGANVGLLVAFEAAKPGEARFFNWEYTLDGGKTFLPMPPTPTGKTSLQNLTPLTMVGVRVNLNLVNGPGTWSQVVAILVH